MRHQHTRNKYTLCHKETIALNDEKSRVNRTKLRFFFINKTKRVRISFKNDSGTKPSGIVRFGLQIRHLVVILYSSAVIFCHLIIKCYI